MKIHLSRFGYRTACGKHLSDSRHIVRNFPSDVTCLTCIKIRDRRG